MDLLASEGGRFFLLVLAGIGFLLQWDQVVESIREATKKRGDDNPEEKSPPRED